MEHKIKIDGLGYRTMPNDESEVLWFLRQKIKSLNKAAQTNYLLAFKEKHFSQIEAAFRIQGFIKSMVSERQEADREKRKDARFVKNEIEMIGFVAKYEEEKKQRTFYLCNN